MTPFEVSGCATAWQNWPNSARTRVTLRWVTVRSPALVGSTRCMVRCTVTDVAWFRLPQPAIAAEAADPAAEEAEADDAEAADAPAADDPAADDVAGAAAGAEAVTEPHPASAEHSSTPRTVPRTWRGDIMPL
jgi:hypothetical protein